MNAEPGRQFIDTNILVYAHDISNTAKSRKAKSLVMELWHNRKGCISIQVIQEFFVTVTKKAASPMSCDAAAGIIKDISQWTIHSPDSDDVLSAISLQKRYKTSFWDSMLICSAKKLGCDTIWSEDLNDGQEYSGIKVKNPFA